MLPRNFYCTSSSDPQKYFVHNTSTIRRPSVAIPLCSSAYTTRFTKSGKVQKLFHLRGLALLARTWHVRLPETEAAGLRFDVCHVRINTFMMLRPVFTATTVVALYSMQRSKKRVRVWARWHCFVALARGAVYCMTLENELWLFSPR